MSDRLECASSFLRNIGCVLLSLFCLHGATRGQEHPSQAFEVESIDFEGNEAFTDGELRDRMSTKVTPGFFGKFLYGISEGLGSENQYFDQTTFDGDLIRLQELYKDNGFSNVRIDTALHFSAEERTMTIALSVTEGYRSIIDSIQYSGLVGVAGEVWVGIYDDPEIKKGDPFRKSVVEDEVHRVGTILLNEGYASSSFVRDSSGAFRLLSTGNYLVVLRFHQGKRFLFGDIIVRRPPDSLAANRIDDEDIIRQLDYAPGNTFSEAKRQSSERNLNRLRVFDQARIEVDVPPDTGTSNRVTSLVTVKPSDKHEISPEVTISDEDKAFNLGTGLVYTQRNFFGGARIFTARLRFRTQTLFAFPDYFKTNSDAVSNLDLSFEVLQPYVFTNKIKGHWTFSLILDKQELYRQEILKNVFGVTARLAQFTTGTVDWTLQKVRLQRNTSVVLDLSDPTIKAQYDELLIQEMETQFNSILSFTIVRDKTNDIFSPSAGFAHSATIEESGVLPLIVKQDLPFTQFYRLLLLGRWFYDPSYDRLWIVATKLKGGIEEKYGESRSDTTRTIPQTHRFYGGGGGSVRGWNSRELSASGVPDLGGNLAFEGSLELRSNILRTFKDEILDHIWLVTFLDAGNVWAEVNDFQVKGIAIATGFGVRYDTFFGPFRIDFGIRVYDPGAPDNRWITERRFFGDTVRQGVIHFGIGHAF